MLTLLPLRTVVALGVALAYGAGFWLVLLHHAEGGHESREPALLIHGLRDGTLALPAVLAAAWLGAALALRLVDREQRLPTSWRAGLVTAGAAAAAAIVLAAGNPLHAAFFDAHETMQLPAALHAARDALIALIAGLPLAAFAVVATGRRAAVGAALAAPPAEAVPVGDGPRPLALTRRGFVGVGAGGLTVAAIGATTVARSPARAQTPPPDRLALHINEGHVPMVDGTLVYMRGYGDAPPAPGDPRPALTIAPTAFLVEGGGPVDGRFYPPDAEHPEEGCPSDAGRDDSGVGLHFIRRKHWGSFFPRRVIVAETGSEIRLSVTNHLNGPHSFTIPGAGVDERIEPGATKLIDFDAPGAGTYVYQDTVDAPVNRVLGLYGVLVVVPADYPWALDEHGEGEFERQWVWIFHDIDPEWARRARMGVRIDPVATPSVPRYFTLNDRSGVFSIAHSLDEEENRRTHEDTKPCGHGRRVDVRDFRNEAVGTGQVLRLVNTGIARHQPHFHGNHVWTVSIDNEILSRHTPRIVDGHIRLQHWEDVVELDPLATKAVMLPIKPPPDALDVVVENQRCDWVYPMHCHAEMSQTAGGGLYPGGQVSDWILKP